MFRPEGTKGHQSRDIRLAPARNDAVNVMNSYIAAAERAVAASAADTVSRFTLTASHGEGSVRECEQTGAKR